ncbi:MAG TPA: DUF1972 domain-containing protein [Bacteroides sp.]|nr:DUF1972 domain-containing protein [Bacteroides sp.]
MRIAITGTRGIPNNYGGFEEFAENLSAGLAGLGNNVWVYNSFSHSFQENNHQGVGIIRKSALKGYLEASGNYLYDLKCIKDAIRREADVILECGYATAAPWYPYLPRRGTKLVTHMDGMEWQREKWGVITKKVIRRTESTAVRYSDAIVCDHPVIAKYYKEKYSVEASMIPFGADIRQNWDEGILEGFGINPGCYYLIVARLEPENKIQMIIDGFLASPVQEPLLIVGDYSRKYGKKMYRQYGKDKRLKFLGGIFDSEKLDHLRHYSIASFHGHSVGGTNPSLLEAMAAGTLIFAHDNPYNKWVLGENAGYFRSAAEVTDCIKDLGKLDRDKFIGNNLVRTRADFQWDSVVKQYEELFNSLVG